MNSQYTSAFTLFLIAALIFSATAELGATCVSAASVAVESSNLLMWGDSARECFENPDSLSVKSVNAECWSKKVRMLMPLLTDKAMTLSTAIEQAETLDHDYADSKVRSKELHFSFQVTYLNALSSGRPTADLSHRTLTKAVFHLLQILFQVFAKTSVTKHCVHAIVGSVFAPSIFNALTGHLARIPVNKSSFPSPVTG